MDAVSICHTFDDLFPTQFEFMVIYHLHCMDRVEGFQYNEIKLAIRETAKLPFWGDAKEPQVEKTLKNLLRSFLERPPDKVGFYLLTPHAVKIIEIVLHRIDNPYLRFPLKKTFEDYFALPEDAGCDIAHLEKWYRLGFQDNAQKVVLSHLEGLKLAVEDAIKDLNLVLEADHLSAIQMLERFTNHFLNLSMQARQITEAIKMKTDTYYRLRDIADAFHQKISFGTNEQSITQDDWNKVELIKGNVNAFFERVDQQLDLINTKMAFASTKITELQESFKAQSHFKMKLKKTLAWLLENSKPDLKGWVRLPAQFPAKERVFQRFQFHTLRYYDLGFLKKALPVDIVLDDAYEIAQRDAFEQELKEQIMIQHQVESWQQKLTVDGLVNVSEEMLLLMEKMPDSISLSVQAGYELIRNLGDNVTLSIQNELHSNHTKTLHLWKTTVQNNQNTIS